MRKAAIILALLSLVTPLAGASDNGAAAIVGLWKTEPNPNGCAIVEIGRDGSTFNGRIVWLEKPVYGPDEPRPGQPKVDLNNPNPELRNRPIMGLEILKGFVYKGHGRWKEGTIYDPNVGKTYKCKMWLVGHDTLKVRGFIGFSFLGRNAVWHRVGHLPQQPKARVEPAASSASQPHASSPTPTR